MATPCIAQTLASFHRFFDRLTAGAGVCAGGDAVADAGAVAPSLDKPPGATL